MAWRRLLSDLFWCLPRLHCRRFLAITFFDDYPSIDDYPSVFRSLDNVSDVTGIFAASISRIALSASLW